MTNWKIFLPVGRYRIYLVNRAKKKTTFVTCRTFQVLLTVWDFSSYYNFRMWFQLVVHHFIANLLKRCTYLLDLVYYTFVFYWILRAVKLHEIYTQEILLSPFSKPLTEKLNILTTFLSSIVSSCYCNEWWMWQFVLLRTAQFLYQNIINKFTN